MLRKRNSFVKKNNRRQRIDNQTIGRNRNKKRRCNQGEFLGKGVLLVNCNTKNQKHKTSQKIEGEGLKPTLTDVYYNPYI